MSILNTVSQWVSIGAEVAGALAGVSVFVAAITVIFEYRSGLRDERRLKNEMWRVSYRNLSIKYKTVLTHPATAPGPVTGALSSRGSPIGRKVSPDITLPSPRRTAATTEPATSQFLIFQLDVQNIGDGPVDVWACFVEARELNTRDHREAWGGNIEWNDLDPYYFDTEVPEWEHLAGISNTRHVVYSQDDYISLDPKEQDTLTRIDRIDPVQRHITLLYRTFLVGHGYGGVFREQPPSDSLAWQRLQQAFFNVSGPSFRILFNERNPLERVADIDGFSCFLLYHMAFTDDVRNQIGWTNIDRVNSKLEGDWGQDHQYPDAFRMVKAELAPCEERWRRSWVAFNQAVAQCKKLKRGFADLVTSNWKPDIPGVAVDDLDVTTLSASQAFDRLPAYLRWNPQDDDSLPYWEKYFIVTLTPNDEVASHGEPQ